MARRKALRAIGSVLKENGEEYYLRFLWFENIDEMMLSEILERRMANGFV